MVGIDVLGGPFDINLNVYCIQLGLIDKINTQTQILFASR